MLDRIDASDLLGNKQIKQIGKKLADEVKNGNPAKHYCVKRKLQDNIYECQSKGDKNMNAMMNLANKPTVRDIIEFKDQLLTSKKIERCRNVSFIDAYVHKQTYFVIMDIAA